MTGRAEATVGRRRVFYIPGYDPFPPRRYRELYRAEAARQSAVSGHAITVSPGSDTQRGWRVDAEVEGVAVRTEVEVLVWSDIVKDSMGQGLLSSYWQLARTLWITLASGTLARLLRLRKGPTIAALYPVAVLILALALALLAGLAVGQGTRAALASVAPGGAAAAGILAGAATVWAVLAAARRLDRWTYAFYLLHDYAFSARDRGAYPAELAARLNDFVASVSAAASGPWDEVLVVGHSSGAHIAVSVMADVLRGGLPPDAPAMSLLTLGHVVPMASFLPEATRLRADLRDLSLREDIVWVDVSAPGDGCSFALCDPVSVTGVAVPGKRWPLVVSAAFTRTLSPERWRQLRWRFFRLHFQYLCAFDRPEGYDYFAITAGPRTLGERFTGRQPSKSRIVTPVSGHRSVA